MEDERSGEILFRVDALDREEMGRPVHETEPDLIADAEVAVRRLVVVDQDAVGCERLDRALDHPDVEDGARGCRVDRDVRGVAAAIDVTGGADSDAGRGLDLGELD